MQNDKLLSLLRSPSSGKGYDERAYLLLVEAWDGLVATSVVGIRIINQVVVARAHRPQL